MWQNLLFWDLSCHTILTILDIVDLAWSIAASQVSKKGNKQKKYISEASGPKMVVVIFFTVCF